MKYKNKKAFALVESLKVVIITICIMMVGFSYILDLLKYNSIKNKISEISETGDLYGLIDKTKEIGDLSKFSFLDENQKNKLQTKRILLTCEMISKLVNTDDKFKNNIATLELLKIELKKSRIDCFNKIGNIKKETIILDNIKTEETTKKECVKIINENKKDFIKNKKFDIEKVQLNYLICINQKIKDYKYKDDILYNLSENKFEINNK